MILREIKLLSDNPEIINLLRRLGIKIGKDEGLPKIGEYFIEFQGIRYEGNSLIELENILSNLLGTYVVVPAYNEEKTIGKVLDELLAIFPRERIIVVNDGSEDRTEEIAKSKGVRVLTHLINRGLGGALGTGIEYAIKKGAKIIVTFDADGQHLVEDALKVMKPVVEGKAELAIGSRLKGIPLKCHL